jgi:hypothetical protein
VRSLPRIVSSIPSDLRNFLDRVREYLGEGSDERFVTLGELRRGGIVGTTPNGAVIPPTEYAVQTPTVPKNVTVTGGFAVLFIEWDTPDYLGHAYAEVWAAPTDDFAAKELVGTAEGNIFTHSLGTGATRYYWVRFVNLLDTVGPFNGTAGTPGTTSQDPDYLIEVLSDAYGVTGPAPFFQIDTPTVINGVTIPAGTYIKQAWIADATISRAKIQDLAVDNAKINDLSVAKLTAGAMQVGSYIQSTSYTAGSVGWRINADGSAEFSNVTVRGSIYSTVGTIGGTTLSATGIQANYVANTSGWKIGSDGSAELNNLLARGTLLGGAATGYNSGGTGFFAGTDSGSYKWRVGDITTASTPKYVRWTGSNLEISSGLTDIINTPNVTDTAINNVDFAAQSGSTNIVRGAAAVTVTSITFTTPVAMNSSRGIFCNASLDFLSNGGNAEPSITIRLITNFAFSIYNIGDPVRNIVSVNHYNTSGNTSSAALVGMLYSAQNGTLLPAGSYTLQLRVTNTNGTNSSIDVSNGVLSMQTVKK